MATKCPEVLMARIGVMQALNRDRPVPEPGPRRKGDQSLQGHSMKPGLQIATIAFRLSTRGKRRNETKEATP